MSSGVQILLLGLLNSSHGQHRPQKRDRRLLSTPPRHLVLSPALQERRLRRMGGRLPALFQGGGCWCCSPAHTAALLVWGLGRRCGCVSLGGLTGACSVPGEVFSAALWELFCGPCRCWAAPRCKSLQDKNTVFMLSGLRALGAVQGSEPPVTNSGLQGI